MYEADNVYTGSTEHISEPLSQVRERKKEQDQVLSGLPQIKQTIKSLEDSAEFYEKSVEAVAEEYLTKPDEFMHIVMGNKIAAKNLRIEAEKLKSLVTEYTED